MYNDPSITSARFKRSDIPYVSRAWDYGTNNKAGTSCYSDSRLANICIHTALLATYSSSGFVQDEYVKDGWTDRAQTMRLTRLGDRRSCSRMKYRVLKLWSLHNFIVAATASSNRTNEFLGRCIPREASSSISLFPFSW